MPSPTAGLFGGLATGIFGRMREHEDEQRKMDWEERQGALKSLGSLLEHATPETRPVIYKQMADVMKLKGKHRGVWDMLTGQGRDDYHQQLSQQLGGVFGNVVGPKKYEELQQQGVAQDLGAAFRANSPYVRSDAPKPVEGKIALRDPISEHLDALRQQYGIQNDRRAAEIELRNRLAGEREAANDLRDSEFKFKDREHAATIAAEKKVRAAATALALKRQSKVPSDEEYAMAAEQVAATDGLNVDKLKAQIGLIGAETKRNEAQAEYYGSGGAGGLGRPMTENQQRTFDAAQRAQAAGTYEKWNKAKANITRLDTEHQATRQQLLQIAQRNGVDYDEANGRFLKEGVPVGVDELDQIGSRTTALLSKMAKLAADKAAAANELQGHRSTLEGQFPQLYTFGDQWSITPNPEVGGLAPAGAPRTAAPPPFPTGAAQPLAGVEEYHQSATTKNGEPVPPMKPGQILETGRGRFKVVEILGKTADGKIRYKIVPAN